MIHRSSIDAAVKRLQSATRLTAKERRAVLLLAGGAVQGPKNALGLTGTTKRTARSERRERMAEIRRVVMERAGGLCELCGAKAIDAHHILSGPLRRLRESVETVIALCVPCHRAIHRGDLDALYHAQAYCVSSGMHEAGAALARRIDKVLEARRPTGEKGRTR